MEEMKDNYLIVHALREDLMRAYRKVAPTCWTQREAWEKTAASPAPRYYISGAETYRKMLDLSHGDRSRIDKMRPLKRDMYLSLYDTLLRISQEKRFIGKPLRFICDFLVLEPAPSFFLAPNAVKFIYGNYKKYGKDFPTRKNLKQRKKEYEDESGSDNH